MVQRNITIQKWSNYREHKNNIIIIKKIIPSITTKMTPIEAQFQRQQNKPLLTQHLNTTKHACRNS